MGYFSVVIVLCFEHCNNCHVIACNFYVDELTGGRSDFGRQRTIRNESDVTREQQRDIVFDCVIIFNQRRSFTGFKEIGNYSGIDEWGLPKIQVSLSTVKTIYLEFSRDLRNSESGSFSSLGIFSKN